jgi:tetratricopeptide (TPR) repeat protein
VYDDDLLSVAAMTRRLAAKSLVTVTSAQRFRMLESIRAFARTCANDAGELEASLERHARWFATGAISKTDAHGWAHEIDGFEIVHDDLVAALAWTTSNDPGLALDVLEPLQLFWMRRGRWAEARALSSRTLDATSTISSEGRIRALSRTAELALRQGDFDTARALFEDAIGVGRSVYGDDRTQMLLADLGLVALRRGELDEAEALLSRALATARSMNFEPQVAVILIHLAETARLKGDSERAWAFGNEALERAIQLGMNELILPARIGVGAVAHERGDIDQARSFYRAALDDAVAVGDSSVLYLTYRLGLLEFESGDLSTAALLLTDAIMQGRDLDARADLAESMEAAVAVIADNHPDHAARLLAAVDSLRGQIGFPRGPADVATYQALRERISSGAEGSFEADQALGATWSLEIAVNAALDDLAQISTRHEARPDGRAS